MLCGNTRKYRFGRAATGLTVMQLIADNRSCRSQVASFQSLLVRPHSFALLDLRVVRSGFYISNAEGERAVYRHPSDSLTVASTVPVSELDESGEANSCKGNGMQQRSEKRE